MCVLQLNGSSADWLAVWLCRAGLGCLAAGHWVSRGLSGQLVHDGSQGKWGHCGGLDCGQNVDPADIVVAVRTRFRTTTRLCQCFWTLLSCNVQYFIQSEKQWPARGTNSCIYKSLILTVHTSTEKQIYLKLKHYIFTKIRTILKNKKTSN